MPEVWEQERIFRTLDIQLDLVRNINMILDIIAEEMTEQQAMDNLVDMRLCEAHRLAILRLTPVRYLQNDLESKLRGVVIDEYQNLLPNRGISSGASNNTWKERFPTLSSSSRVTVEDLKEIEQTTEILMEVKDDLKALWQDDMIRTLLKKRNYPLQNSQRSWLSNIWRRFKTEPATAS